jgi:uncharacterized protein (DUF1800 family)
MLRALSPTQWNYVTAAHLLNRAGFGGRPAEIEAAVKAGLEKTVEQLINFESEPEASTNPDWAKADPEKFKRLREYRDADPEKRKQMQRMQQREQRERIVELRQWWLQRMVSGRRPLQEKLTLFWHGHFATSAQKVKDAYLMWKQNDIFRRNAAGNWLTMLEQVSKDPAMLLWLDQAQSRKEHPNENFAREVMELFALGEGNYTERDVTEAARALTGWSFERGTQEFTFRPAAHDRGAKTILGRTGNFNGDDVLKIIANQPQSARFIATKLWRFFAEDNPPDAIVNILAAQLQASKLELKPVLRTMFMCEAFYAPSVIRNQVKSPTQWLVSSVRLLERDLPPPMIAMNSMRTLGQELFAPPNVKGWDGGLAWITTNNLLSRYNMSAYLVLGENPMLPPPGKGKKPARPRERRFRPGAPTQVTKIFSDEERSTKPKLVAGLERRFIQGPLKERQQRALVDYLDGLGSLDEEDILHAIRLVMSTPEFQLC